MSVSVIAALIVFAVGAALCPIVFLLRMRGVSRGHVVLIAAVPALATVLLAAACIYASAHGVAISPLEIVGLIILVLLPGATALLTALVVQSRRSTPRMPEARPLRPEEEGRGPHREATEND